MVRPIERLQGRAAYKQSLATKEQYDFEGSDCCVLNGANGGARSALAEAHVEHEDWIQARDTDVGKRVAFGGVVRADIKGMGKVYDWRGSGWTRPNGGEIGRLMGFVDHIPVIHNAPGIADFIRLRDVLVAQGLMVHGSTDRAGNVALFVELDKLCYQARGANAQSCGFEHMHYSTGEAWSERQIRAVAYSHWRAREYQGVPNRRAKLSSGNGIAYFRSRGYTTHESVSAYAGYHDRSDPGDGLERDYDKVEHLVRYFDKHRNFQGA